jgi:thiol-disulfide isomerase/thioredoxin
VSGFAGEARFVAENYGDSELAKRHGLTHYPAIFVDDVLVATPADFGFYGKGEGSDNGRYAPLKSAASHERFRADLDRMIRLILAGRSEDARAQADPAPDVVVEALPDVAFTDLDGKRLARADLAGRAVVVELWATWCPPCRSTLGWLANLKARHGDRLAVVTVAVDSDAADVIRIRDGLGAPFVWTMADGEVVRALGDVTSVPTLFLFGPDGKTGGVFYGAPPTLHADAETALGRLLPAS